MMRELILRDLSLWDCLWQSLVFLALGLAAGWLLRRRPSRAYAALLLAMMAAALVPFLSAMVRHGQLGAFPAAPEESVYVRLHRPEPLAQGARAAPPALDVSRPVTGVGPGRSPSTLPSLPWRPVLLSGWLTAALLLLARLAATFLYGARLVRQAQRSGCEEIQQAAERTASRLRLAHGLQIRASDRIHSPVVWCWTRPPVLLVPCALGHQDIEWTGVVAHELAHCRRRDHLTGLAAELLASLLPWNPLMWLARRFLIRLGEQACDDWVVASGQPSEDYAEALLCFRPQKQMAFWPAVVSSKTGLAHRIRRILNDACGNPRTGTRWALALGIITICTGVGVAFAQTRPVPSETPAKPGERPAKSLHQAATDGDLEQVKKLIAQGADVKARDMCGRTALHFAAYRSRTEVARLLLREGAYVDATDNWRATSLHYAAMRGDKQTVELLLSKGADINAKGGGSRTPLFEAMASPALGRREVVELLAAKGAKGPALHLAAYLGDMEELKKCLQEGVDVNTQEGSGGTALHAAACSGKKDIVQFLIDKGARVDTTALYHAAIHNSEDIADLLLAKGADVNARGNGGGLIKMAIYAFLSPEHKTAYSSKDAVKVLISKGANINLKDWGGYTPLVDAIWVRDKELVELLIGKGADVNAEDKDGCTPYYWAVTEGDMAIVELLIAKGAAPTSTISNLHLAAITGDSAKVNKLIEEGADVNAKDRCGWTPLHYATDENHKDVVELLIAKGADVNAKEEGAGTPLHTTRQKDVAELLIAKGADANAKDDKGVTPLHGVCVRGLKDVAELLIAKGADVNARTSGASTMFRASLPPLTTPLHVACLFARKDVAELLIAKGTNINAKDNNGRTPLSLAQERGHAEIIELLHQHGAKE